MGRLENKVAVVTGGSSGIGLATIQKFTAEGTTAIAADVSAPADAGIAFIQTDVTAEQSLQAMVDQVVTQYGHLDILVANAGVVEQKAGVADIDMDNWNKVIAIDLTGVVLTNKVAVAQMLKQGSGSVINMSSILGVVGAAKSQAYSAAKAGVANYTKSQAVTYAQQGIRFNSIAPG